MNTSNQTTPLSSRQMSTLGLQRVTQLPLNRALLCGVISLGLLITQLANAETLEHANASQIAPDQSLQTNDAPCGKNTVAVINTDQHDQYTFCADGDGVAVMELLYDDGSRPSLLDKYTDPIELLTAIMPLHADIPEDIVESIRNGERLAKHTTPFTVGQTKYFDEPAAALESSKGACSPPSLSFSINEFVNDTTFCGFVAGQSVSSGNSSWHAHGASAYNVPGEGSGSHAGPHLPPYEFYYADEDEEGDARYGRARVRSCGGTTKFRGWKKPSPTTGSWSPIATYNVPGGYTYTMKWYSNSQHSLWMGYDADDIWFRADALGNASFGSRFYFLKYAWGTNCDLKY